MASSRLDRLAKVRPDLLDPRPGHLVPAVRRPLAALVVPLRVVRLRVVRLRMVRRRVVRLRVVRLRAVSVHLPVVQLPAASLLLLPRPRHRRRILTVPRPALP